MKRSTSLALVALAVACFGAPSAAQATPVYWNLFNVEGESSASAIYVTYATLADMLTDSNRQGQFVPDTTGDAASNVVGSGSDGTTFWSLFNVEGESSASAVYVTYPTLADMLTDSNRLGQFVPDTTGDAASNVVGSGSDGTIYWSLFNVEGENSAAAVYVTYATLADMLTDSNRLGQFVPDTTGDAARNVVGSGAFVMANDMDHTIPEPSSLGLLAVGLVLLGLVLARRRAAVPARGRSSRGATAG